MSNKKFEPKGRVDGIDKHASNRLKMRRIMLGLSQKELSEAAGVSIQQVQKYENAKNRMSSSKLACFAKLLDVPVAYFFDNPSKQDPQYSMSSTGQIDDVAETNAEYQVNILDPQYMEKETLTLIKAFSTVKDPQIRKKILDLIRSM